MGAQRSDINAHLLMLREHYVNDLDFMLVLPTNITYNVIIYTKLRLRKKLECSEVLQKCYAEFLHKVTISKTSKLIDYGRFFTISIF